MPASAQSTEVVGRRIELCLQMLALGAYVFPLQPGGKKPLVPKAQGGGGFLDAKPDAEMARTFLANAGQPNYGVAFPPDSDVFVLDLDGGGDEARPDWKEDWQRLYERLGPPGLTYIVRTPSGGRHVYYRWRTDLYGPLPPGDEMLGWTVRKPWKGYLVGPGSVVDGQVYEPVGLPTISELPEHWARAALNEVATKDHSSGTIIRVGGVGPANVSKGHRHNFLRDRARHMVGLGLTGEALFVAVADLNRQLAEPKSELKVRRAIGEAEARFEPDPVDTKGREIQRAHGDVRDVHVELPFYTAQEIEAMPDADIAWAWGDYLAVGAITELVGAPKAGKTTLVFGLINALVVGHRYLERATIRTPVVVLTEQGPTSLRAVMRRTGIAERPDVHFLLHRDARGEEWPLIVDAAVQRCTQTGARVLVVDTLPAFAGLSGETENNAGDALEAMDPLLHAAAGGLAVFINRHRRKGGALDVADEGRGSSAFSGVVDVIVTLRRRSGMSRPTIRELVAASRFDETPEELIVELQPDKGYVALGTEAAIAAQEAEQAILEALEEALDGLTLRELIEASGKVRRTVERARDDLSGAGLIERFGKGGRSDPYRWRIRRAHDPTPKGVHVGVHNESGTGNGASSDDDATVTPRPATSPGTWIDPCRDYANHRAQHRRIADGWICDICSEGEPA